MADRQRGIYGKFSVSRLDGEDAEGGSRQHIITFILDVTYDPLSRDAAEALATELGFSDATTLAEHQRTVFKVKRTDGRDAPGGDKVAAHYVVLDLYYSPEARKAAMHYAQSVRADGYDLLAQDIESMVSTLEREYAANNPDSPVAATVDGDAEEEPVYDTGPLEPLEEEDNED